MIDSGAVTSATTHSNPISPCEPPAAGNTTIIPGPENSGGATKAHRKRGMHRSPLLYEAIRLLNEHRYATFRLLDNPDFSDAIAATKNGAAALMIAVIYSQKQVPDAHTLRELFPEKVDKARALVPITPYRTMIWVNSPVAGWRFYRVDIGGISYDWDLAKELGK